MYFTTPETPVARTRHFCTNCYRVIDPGEMYQRGRGYDGGDAWTYKTCAHCQAVIRLYDPQDYNGLYSEDGMEAWLDNGARDVSEARHMAGYRMRWRTKSGALLPIPNRTNRSEETR